MNYYQNVRFIISDLDQTLLHQDKKISEYSLSILKRCQAQGLLIGFATARSEIAVRELSPNFWPDIIISSGGASARVGEKVLFRCVMPAIRSDEFISIVANSPKVSKITAHVDEGVYWSQEDGGHRPAGYAHHRYVDFRKAFGRDLFCMSIATKDDAWMQETASAFPEFEFLSYTGEHLYRFAQKGADKIAALREIAKALSLQMNEIIAFGDDVNDLGLMEECGRGIAVSNAVDLVKKTADVVLPLSNEEDGPAHFIEENILAKSKPLVNA